MKRASALPLAAHEVGITHAVHCSTMSVYDGALEVCYFFDEEMTPDTRGTYGSTKRLGEEVCRNAWNRYRKWLLCCAGSDEIG